MNAKDRLLIYLEYLDVGQNAFEKKVGIANGYISHSKGSIGTSTLKKIADACHDLNMEWLVIGEGEMLKSGAKPAKIVANDDEVIYYVPLLPIYAQGGSLNDFVVSVKDSDCEMIVSPIKSADFAINVSGDSMYPEYPSGSQILIKRINERAFIDWGKTYVLDTCNGTVIKRIFPSDSKDPGIVKCVSINPDYPPFEVNLSEDVYGVYRVLMLMATK